MVNVFTASFRNFGIRYQMVSHLLTNLLTLSDQFSLVIEAMWKLKTELKQEKPHFMLQLK
jgi:hypothetical protein